MTDDVKLAKYLPGLVWYRPFEPFAYALVRFTTGALIAVHGVDRVFMTGFGRELGPHLGSLPVSAVGWLELAGGICLALGLLTRPVALLLAIEWFLIALAVPLRPGASWLLLGATPKFSTIIAVLCFAFLLRGGGRISFDRLLGKEF